MVMHVGKPNSAEEPEVDDTPRAAVRAAPSFDELYAAEYPRVVRLLVASTGRLDLAEELTQDAFLAAHARWAKVSTYDEPGGWVRHVSR